MKKLLILLIFMLIGCATTLPKPHPEIKELVYIEPFDYWITTPAPGFKSVTLNVVNRKYIDVLVDVVCQSCNGTPFTKNDVLVKSLSSKRVSVPLGLSRGKVYCRIKSVR